MSLTWLITNIFAAFLLPPFNGLLLVGAGWLLWQRWPRIARSLVGTGLMLLIVLAMPIVGDGMLRTLEPKNALQPGDIPASGAQAIVILGGGRYRDALEYGGDTVGTSSLVRLRYGAWLHKKTGLPVLVTGGKPDGGDKSEAETMNNTLQGEFGITVRWIEGQSDNTLQNSRFSAALLRKDGISNIILVTSAEHMLRAERTFRKEGLIVLAAPTVFHSRRPMTPLDFLPSGYSAVRAAIHEWIGLLWYRLRD